MFVGVACTVAFLPLPAVLALSHAMHKLNFPMCVPFPMLCLPSKFRPRFTHVLHRSSAMFKLACLCVFQCMVPDTSMLSLILPAINELHLTMPCRTFSQSATPCGSIVCWFIVALRCLAGVLLHACVNSVVVCFVASLILQENWWCLYLVRGLHFLSSHGGYCAPGRRLPRSNLPISQRRGKRFPCRLPRLPGACPVRGYKHKNSSSWQGQIQ